MIALVLFPEPSAEGWRHRRSASAGCAPARAPNGWPSRRGGLQDLDQIVRRAIHRLLAENLDLEQDRLLPARLQDQRPVDRLQGDRRRFEIGQSRVVGGKRDGELRFRVVGIGLRQRLHELQRRRLVRLGGERPVELEERFAQSRTGGRGVGQRTLEVGLRDRIRESRRRPSSPATTCFARSAVGSSSDHSVAASSASVRWRAASAISVARRANRASRTSFAHLVVRARGKCRIAPLQGDVAHEQSIHELGGELAGRAGGRGGAFGALRGARLRRALRRNDEQRRERQGAQEGGGVKSSPSCSSGGSGKRKRRCASLPAGKGELS